jgi:hypothetical protein
MRDAPPVSNQYHLADIDASNAGEMRALFAEVFNKQMSEAFWQWKYQHATGHSIGVWHGAALVAHFGGVGADIVWAGKPARAVQIVDVMVSPRVRNGVRSQSPFFLMARQFLQRYIGYQQPYLLGYGFPSHRHLQLAARLNLYAPVGDMTEMRLENPSPRWHDRWWHTALLTRHNLPAFHSKIDILWAQMQQSLPTAIMVRKDSARLSYRYLKHPEHSYVVWLIQQQLTSTPKALVVLKLESDKVLLMDAICDYQRLAEVLRWTALQVRQQWQLPLTAWLSTAFALQYCPAGAELQPLPIATPANIWTAAPTPAELQDRWCLMAGDTDYL